MGPVTNHRTKNLIKWSLQGAGLICILFSSEFQEAAMAQVIVLVMGYNIPKSWVSKSKSYWYGLWMYFENAKINFYCLNILGEENFHQKSNC